MPRFVIDLWMDGYESDEEMKSACKVFINQELDFSASEVKIMSEDDVNYPIKKYAELIHHLNDAVKYFRENVSHKDVPDVVKVWEQVIEETTKEMDNWQEV